jgi:Helix-turn-helix domain
VNIFAASQTKRVCVGRPVRDRKLTSAFWLGRPHAKMLAASQTKKVWKMQITSKLTNSPPPLPGNAVLLDDWQVAEITGRARPTLQKDRLRGGGIPFVRIGRLVRYRRSDVGRWLAGLRTLHSTSEGPFLESGRGGTSNDLAPESAKERAAGGKTCGSLISNCASSPRGQLNRIYDGNYTRHPRQ